MVSSGRRKKMMLGAAILSGLLLMTSTAYGAKKTYPWWVNHLDLLPGDQSVQISFDADHDPRGGLAGLVVTSANAGNQSSGGGDKVVWLALESGFCDFLYGITVCYQVYNTTAAPTSIDLIRVAQVLDPPSQAVVLWEDYTDRTYPGPVCATCLLPPKAKSIKTWKGPLYLYLRVNFASPEDVIVIRGLAGRTK